MKKIEINKYESPMVELVAIENSDVITTSAGDPALGDTRIWDVTW